MIDQNDGSAFFYLGDVSGKGLPAALIMAALSTKIKGESLHYNDTATLLQAVNSAMFDLLSQEGYFVTLVVGKYWPRTGDMHLINAGHLQPIWIKKSGPTKIQSPINLPIGIETNVSYKGILLQLSPGESIIFMTDGVTEAENKDGELFSLNRIMSKLHSCDTPPWAKALVRSKILKKLHSSKPKISC